MRTFVRPTGYVTFRGRIVVALVALGVSLISADRAGVGAFAAEPNTAIRPFRINVPEAELAELRRRVLATRWPDKETVADQSQGIQLAKLQELVRYWGTAYDWRKVEAQLIACLRPGVINQNTSHRRGGHCDEVCAILPLNAIDLDQPQVRLIDQRGRLKRVTGVLPAHVVVGEPMQLIVQNREERICRWNFALCISPKVG